MGIGEDEYRTRDGRASFLFLFVETPSYFEVNIVSMPCYGARNTGCHETHRLDSGLSGLMKICFGDASSIDTLEIAREYAAAWAENTWQYILIGERF